MTFEKLSIGSIFQFDFGANLFNAIYCIYGVKLKSGYLNYRFFLSSYRSPYNVCFSFNITHYKKIGASSYRRISDGKFFLIHNLQTPIL